MPTAKTTIIASGKSRLTPEYHRFLGIRQRCLNPTSPAYKDYGGRGIKVCVGWSTFEQFHQDVGDRPTEEHSLDRTNNNGHYSCGKCIECVEKNWPKNWRWATPLQQSNNTRANVLLTKNGKTLTITAWAKEMGVSYGTLSSRRSRGLSPEQILAPVCRRRRHRG
jgi:hypothetical protein